MKALTDIGLKVFLLNLIWFILKEPLTESKDQYEIIGDTISAPTLQMAMKWLREVHNIHIYTIDTFIGFKYVIQDMFHHDEDIHPIDGMCFSSNEEAAEEAIKYCLENFI